LPKQNEPKFESKVYAVVTNEMFEEIQKERKFISTSALIRIAISEYLEKKKNVVERTNSTNNIQVTHTKGGYHVKS